MSNEYTLYYSPGACSLAPHLALEEIGRPYALHKILLADGAQRLPEYRALNPKGRVPTLRLADGTLLTEAPAILLFLARRHPEAALLPTEPLDEARVYEWLSWLVTIHAATVASIWRPERFLTEPAAHGPLQEKGRQTLREAYDLIEARLAAGGDFAAGPRYSVADIYLVVFYRWGWRLGLDMRALFPAWERLMQKILARPALSAVLAAESIFIDR